MQFESRKDARALDIALASLLPGFLLRLARLRPHRWVLAKELAGRGEEVLQAVVGAEERGYEQSRMREKEG